MKKILVFALTLTTLNLRAADFDVTYNISIVSYANVQFAVRNVFNGFGLHLNARGINNGASVESKPMYDKINTIQPNYFLEISHNELDSETNRSGVSFGINKTIFKYLYVGVAAGYCDVLNLQKTAVKPYEIVSGNKRYTNTFYTFNDINSITRKLEYELLLGVTPKYGRFYIPIYAGYSYNYSAFWGIGIGYKL